eukprot:TRINITY_DN6162_c0_g1_i8.p1 TRINITY_DN6162_c0_g1~~TRINITY_DN6162_c0_g1_i8.p1  ORF type:complete len:498 (-),score=20.16 TRINITY_DN6162_c0_g1_i8:253-1746(-)
MVASEVCASPEGDAHSWRQHPRLLRHSKTYQGHHDRPGVLLRYYRYVESHSDDDFLRYAVHVAAWVALLPSKLATESMLCGDLELSPVLVLAKYVSLLEGLECSPWLHGTLHLVALRLQSMSRIVPKSHWSILEKALSRTVWEDFRLRCPAVSTKERHSTKRSVSTIERSLAPVQDGCARECSPMRRSKCRVATLGDVRKQQRQTLAAQRRLGDTERKSAIEDVARVAESALETNDPEAMASVVTKAVALLSPPRHQRDGDGLEMTEESKLRLRDAQQVKLRGVVMRLLGLKGSGGLDTHDVGTQKLLKTAFECLRDLLSGVDLAVVRASEQWRSLAAAVGIHLQHVPGGDPARRLHRDGDSRITIRDGVYTPNLQLRRLSSVVHCVQATVLQCRTCGEQVTSNWYVRFGHGLRVLTPLNGHRLCEGKKSPFLPLDGSKCVKDFRFYCDICVHDRRRAECVLCGGVDTCEHGKVRRKCKICRESGRVRARAGRPSKR